MVNIAPSSLHGNEIGSQCHAFSKEVIIDVPKESDILLGRGAGCWSHPGNCLFREMINDALQHCRRSDTRARKSEIFNKIYECVLSKQGRFIKYDHQTKRWYEADKRQALEKISHAIRDRRACLTRECSDTENALAHHLKDDPRSDSSGNAFSKKHVVYPCASVTDFSNQISQSTNSAMFSPPIETNDIIHSLQTKLKQDFCPLPLPFSLHQRKVLAPFATYRYLDLATDYHYQMMSQKKIWSLLREIKSKQINQMPRLTSDVNSICKAKQAFHNFHLTGNDLMIEKDTKFTNSDIKTYAQPQLDSKSQASINDKNGNYLMALATLSTLIKSVN